MKPIAHSLVLALGVMVGVSQSDRGAAGEGQGGGSDRGGALYRRHCAVCHGERGDGAAPLGLGLYPPPRVFARGLFRLVRTAEGLPTEEDILGVLRRGMPGSAMPSFAWLGDADRRSLARHVLDLTIDGMAREQVAAARDQGRDLAQDATRDAVRARFASARLLAPGRPAGLDAATLERGRALYRQSCASCHGEEGKGQPRPLAWSSEKTPSWARDFTAGILRGAATHDELVWRIAAGLPGTTMGPTRIDAAEDLAALVAYVRSLVPLGVADRLVQERRRLVAQGVPAPLPSQPDDPRWQEAPPTPVVLSPLVWHEGAVLGATLRAVHDGETIAIRVEWPDTTRDDRAGSGAPRPDAVALQFSNDAEPPILAMGEAGSPVNLWHWFPFRSDDLSSELERLDRPPHATDRPQADVPLYQPARTGPVAASELRAQGPGAVDLLRGRVLAAALWRDGRWSVVLRRALAARAEREVTFAPGGSLQIAVAVWNGTAGDQRGEKSISSWQELVLAPVPAQR